jgi:hypothetical protein
MRSCLVKLICSFVEYITETVRPLYIAISRFGELMSGSSVLIERDDSPMLYERFTL